ncbi:glycosyl transferase [Vibrio inusitatus NBRC 102082]|uniref:Glycosyl transferase n=1 Tax=Vibrio inusitatus NBRC 102082 TaxID=1219070 RepID=A0A4Y3HT49_9VIBR|nr:glycosyltransferase family 4 protein [Vibrio inusitatus]GEA50333.1 glycosyl transferase [Vibrio inusitatus NBRC 102082]
MTCKSASDLVNYQEVWLLLDSLTFGGIETHVLELARGIAFYKVPVRVILVTRFKQPSAIISKLEQHNIPYSYLHTLINEENHHSLIRQTFQLRRAITQFKPIAIHAHGYKASIISKLAVKTTTGQTKQVSTYHAGEVPKGKVRLYDWLDRYSSLLSDYSLCVSPEIQARLPARSLFLNNFISTDDSIQSLGKRIAFVGRLSHEKGPDRFLDLAEEHSDVSFYLYGDGPMMNDLKSRNVINAQFLGFQPNMNQCWDDIGLLVISSRYEGLPMTALEAMSRGIPVLTLNIGALARLIVHGHNGWISDNTEELALFLEEWLNSTESERETLAENAKETIESQFSTEAVVPQILPLYSKRLLPASFASKSQSF